MKERLTNNLGYKVLSIVLAVIMWLIMVNVSNPIVQDTREVPIEVLNESVLESSGLTYELVGKKTVTVSYDVRIRDQYKIASSDFYASADLAELYDVTGAIPVTVEVANREVKAMIEGTPSTKPGVVRIQTEPLQQKKFTLYTHVTGKPQEGFATGAIATNPEYVYATGAESDIGKINSLGIVVNVEGAYSDMTGSAAVKFYDSNGNELKLADEVDLSLQSVNYYATILQKKDLPLEFAVSGEAGEGYRFVGAEADIPAVKVMGTRARMATISSLEIPKELLNVDGATEDVVVAVDLAQILPKDVQFADAASVVAQVTLHVEKLEERDVDCSLEQLELSGEKEGYTYTFGTDYVTLTVRGLTEDLEMFDDSEVKLTADVSDLEEGFQPISFEVELNDGFEMLGHGPMMILVRAAGEDSENEETKAVSGTARTAE